VVFFYFNSALSGQEIAMQIIKIIQETMRFLLDKSSGMGRENFHIYPTISWRYENAAIFFTKENLFPSFVRPAVPSLCRYPTEDSSASISMQQASANGI
jgi:hypothetical protein